MIDGLTKNIVKKTVKSMKENSSQKKLLIGLPEIQYFKRKCLVNYFNNK